MASNPPPPHTPSIMVRISMLSKNLIGVHSMPELSECMDKGYYCQHTQMSWKKKKRKKKTRKKNAKYLFTDLPWRTPPARSWGWAQWRSAAASHWRTEGWVNIGDGDMTACQHSKCSGLSLFLLFLEWGLWEPIPIESEKHTENTPPPYVDAELLESVNITEVFELNSKWKWKLNGSTRGEKGKQDRIPSYSVYVKDGEVHLSLGVDRTVDLLNEPVEHTRVGGLERHVCKHGHNKLIRRGWSIPLLK